MTSVSSWAARPWADRLALLIAAPVLAGTLGVLAIEGYRVLQPGSVLFVETPPPSLVEAIRAGGLETAHAFLLAKADPNQLTPFRDDALTEGRTVLASPLMVAVAARNGAAALMLLAFGVRMDLPQNAQAACLAQDLNETALADAIRRDGRPVSTPACSSRLSPGAAPLLRYVEPARSR